MLRVLFLVIFVTQSLGKMYSVNESEYRKMPALFLMDDYRECMLMPGGTYCLADYTLHAKGHSDLLHFIQEYSSHRINHFNHTQIHRATCVTKTCEKYLDKSHNTSTDPINALEKCINESIWRDYGIHAALTELKYCKRDDDKLILDASDFIVAAVYAAIILMNVIGSFYDIILCEKDGKAGNRYLLSFSLRRNWDKLTAASGVGPDPRIERLKLFNGLRAMTMVCVIFSHTALVMSFTYIGNPYYIEKAYDDPLKQILFNGSLVTHTFFVMSSFLLAYNLQLFAEKQELSWKQIPKGILLRWIRLTPVYALIIATICTWARHLGDGPLWQLLVTSESDECRRYWWANIFYFNNYIYSQDTCFPQGWYLAADTQLFCLGLVLCVMVRSSRGRKIALTLMFLISLLITAAHTYFQDLEAVVIQSPESYRTVYINDRTFSLVYIRGHTNLSCYTLGLAGGLLTYHWQTVGKDLTKYRKYRWAFWLEFPLAVAVILSGGLFYTDDGTSDFFRVAYAALYKPVFQLLVLIFIIGSIFKYESIYRGIVEWRGFTWAGRVSYSAFLLHTLFQRSLIGSQTEPLVLSDYYVLVILSASIFLSFSFGAILWLMVEAPMAALTRVLVSPKNIDK